MPPFYLQRLYQSKHIHVYFPPSLITRPASQHPARFSTSLPPARPAGPHTIGPVKECLKEGVPDGPAGHSDRSIPPRPVHNTLAGPSAPLFKKAEKGGGGGTQTSVPAGRTQYTGRPRLLTGRPHAIHRPAPPSHRPAARNTPAGPVLSPAGRT